MRLANSDYLAPHRSGSTGIGTDCTFRALERPNPALSPSLLSQGKFTKLVENSNATFVSFACMGLLVNFRFRDRSLSLSQPRRCRCFRSVERFLRSTRLREMHMRCHSLFRFPSLSCLARQKVFDRHSYLFFVIIIVRAIPFG